MSLRDRLLEEDVIGEEQSRPYIFPNNPVQKSSTNVVMKNTACSTCGCLKVKSRRKGCQCICHNGTT
jgi:hypothetical protein